MSGEDGRAIDSALFAEGESYTRQPFVEMRNDSDSLFARNKLEES